MNDPQGSEHVRFSSVEPTNELLPLFESTCAHGTWRVLDLPNKEQVLVLPARSFDALRLLLADPDFYDVLKEGLKDFRATDGAVLNAGARPASQAKAPEVLDALAEGLRAFAKGEGAVFDRQAKPTSSPKP